MDFPFAKLAEDISADRPSGDDLEAEGDNDYMRFTAQIEGVLPQSFAGFDRGAAELPMRLAEVGGLLAKSKDLRLIAAAAKLFILDRDLASFVRSLETAALWLETRWETVYPELLDGDAILRSIALQSLDDIPHTVKPLESAPLFRSRRAGAISLRAVLLAEGRIQPRQGEDGGEDEKAPTPGDIAAAIREADLDEVLNSRGEAQRLLAAIAAIERMWDERTERTGELRLKELNGKAREVLSFLDRAALSRDPSLAAATAPADDGDAPAGGESRPPQGAAVRLGDAMAAMAAAEAYFRAHEPSSPVRLVLAQARSLIGKGFFDALQQLMPEIASQATISFGRDLPLKLPMERLAQLIPEEADAAVGEDGSYDDASTDDQDAEVHEMAPDEMLQEPSEGAGEDAAAKPESASPTAASRPRFAASNRSEALGQLEAAAAYFRAAEPSSAIPTLIEIAKGAAGRDFLALVRESLPPSALRVDEE